MLFSQGYQIKIMSCLSKLLPGTKPPRLPRDFALTALKNDTVSFQAAFAGKAKSSEYARLKVTSDIENAITLRRVVNVAVNIPCSPNRDDNYITDKPCLIPDLLQRLEDNIVVILADNWNGVWIDVEVTDEISAGDHTIKLSLESMDGVELCSESVVLTVFDAKLDEQELIHTEWFHFDCLADYYGIEVFSPRHWEIMEEFVKIAAKRGINMALTPTHTPPLDTYVGGERTTIQLVDVYLNNGAYSFNMEKLDRFVEMCKNAGIKYFEIAHLFTQWGASAAPKIIAEVDGVKKRIFGWDTPAVGGEYTRFLQQYIAAIRQEMDKLGVGENTYFHISDEPSKENIEAYIAAKSSVSEVLSGANLIDALSDVEFYKSGTVTKPIPATDHIEAFVDAGIKGLWAYYCTGQSVDVSNRFVAMPSARNRALGVQLYLYDIEGFLQWGFNFYNSFLSYYHVNPYLTTDSNAFQSGDPFMVYPGADGKPEESIHLMVFAQALTDLRALKTLERMTGRMYVDNIINENAKDKITFKRYPRDDEYYLNLRNRVNREIASYAQKEALK